MAFSNQVPAKYETRDMAAEPPVVEVTHPKRRYVLILGAAFLINFTVGGILFGFGVYQALYESMQDDPHSPFFGASSAEIDLIGSLSASLLTIGAPITVGWTKTFSPRIVICIGGVIFGLANVLASFGTRLWHFQLAQGLLLGIGACLAFMPSMVVTPAWFGPRRGIAMGIVLSGSGIGGLVWAPVLTACIGQLGLHNTLRLSGCLSTALICLSGYVLDWEPTASPTQTGDKPDMSRINRIWHVPLPSWSTAKQPRFAAQILATLFQSAAYFTPVFFTVSYARTLGWSDTSGANLAAVSNACNAIGKISVGFVADRIGRLNAFFLTTLLSALVTFGFWMTSTLIGMHQEVARSLYIVFTVMYGLFASAFVSLFSPALMELFGPEEFPRISGIMYMMQGTAALVGTPLAGLLVQDQNSVRSPRDYVGMAILIGALMSAASVAVGWVRIEAARGRGIKRTGRL